MAPARLHSSSIPELSGNQRSPVAHRELVHVEFAGREVKLPGVLHSFLTVIKGMPAERGVHPNSPPEPPLRTGLLCMSCLGYTLPSRYLISQGFLALTFLHPYTSTRMAMSLSMKVLIVASLSYLGIIEGAIGKEELL